MLEIKRMDIFDAPTVDSIIVHACNCIGVWGGGIAKVFKDKFPMSYFEYKAHCIDNYCIEAKSKILGKSLLLNENDRFIGCLFTSYGFGENADSIEDIIEASEFALHDLCKKAISKNLLNIYSNKFNSGLFNVPWEETEKILIDVLEKYPQINWTVCDWP